MARPGRPSKPITAGVTDHYGWAAVVIVGPDGSVVDRRRAQLVGPDMPASPIHHEAQDLPIDQAVELVATVEASIAEHVRVLWDVVATEHGVAAVSIRSIPDLPADVRDQIRSYHAQTRADPAMYRRLLAEDASRRGWTVEHYEQRRVVDDACRTFGFTEAHLAAPRDELGAPWTVDHRRAFAAALLAQHNSAG